MLEQNNGFLFLFHARDHGKHNSATTSTRDSANIRQEDAFDNNSDIVEDGGQTPYEATLP